MERLVKALTIITLVSNVLFHTVNSQTVGQENPLLAGLKLGKKMNKPILIHFNSYGCVYDEYSEDHKFSNKIDKTVEKDFVLVNLYVDDRSPPDLNLLQALKELGYDLESKFQMKFQTIGRIYMCLEIELFDTAHGHIFGIVNSDLVVLNDAFHYSKRIKGDFMENLETGIANYRIESFRN